MGGVPGTLKSMMKSMVRPIENASRSLMVERTSSGEYRFKVSKHEGNGAAYQFRAPGSRFESIKLTAMRKLFGSVTVASPPENTPERGDEASTAGEDEEVSAVSQSDEASTAGEDDEVSAVSQGDEARTVGQKDDDWTESSDLQEEKQSAKADDVPTCHQNARSGLIKFAFSIYPEDRPNFTKLIDLRFLGMEEERSSALSTLNYAKAYLEAQLKTENLPDQFDSSKHVEATIEEIERLIVLRQKELPSCFDYSEFYKLGVGGLGKNYKEGDFSLEVPLGTLKTIHKKFANGIRLDSDLSAIEKSIDQLNFAKSKLSGHARYHSKHYAVEDFLTRSIAEANELREKIESID